MDLLYQRYSNPLEFMNLYINQGRFGEFVENIIQQENKRIIEKAEKENEDKMFQLYLHPFNNMSFSDWKNEVMRKTAESHSEEVTEEQVVNIVNNSTKILDDFIVG